MEVGVDLKMFKYSLEVDEELLIEEEEIFLPQVSIVFTLFNSGMVVLKLIIFNSVLLNVFIFCRLM